MAGIHATVVVLVEIGRRRSLNGNAWRRMISQASTSPSMDLAVVPVGRFRGRALAAYLELVGSTDPVAPNVPGGLTASGKTRNSITLRWSASSDNVGVAGYGRYRNGSLVSSGTETSYTFSGLTCGTSYSLAVDAYDGAGNSSARAPISASTSSCSSPPPPPPPPGPPPPPPPPPRPPPPPPSLPPVGTANLWVSSMRRFLLAPGGSGRLRRGTGLLQLRGGLCRRFVGRHGRGDGHARASAVRRLVRLEPGRRHQDHHLPRLGRKPDPPGAQRLTEHHLRRSERRRRRRARPPAPHSRTAAARSSPSATAGSAMSATRRPRLSTAAT